jgi:4-hydroxybenzoate polyprenyltransferase
MFQFRSLFTILRKEYFIGLWIGCISFFVLWYYPQYSPPPETILIGLLFMGAFYMCGFLANSIFDVNLEIHYENEKKAVAEAVQSLGKDFLVISLILGTILSLFLAIGLSIKINSYIPLLLFIIGGITGIGYSIPPLRWKMRGSFLHALSLGTSAFFLPAYLTIGLLRSTFESRSLGLGIGYAILHYGLEIGNQLKDASFDRKMGLHTLPFESIKKNSLVGLALLIIGIGLTCIFLWIIIRPSLALICLVILLELLFHTPAWIFYGKLIRNDKESNENLFTLNYALWQNLSMVGLLLISVLLRFVR